MGLEKDLGKEEMFAQENDGKEQQKAFHR